MIQTSSGTPSSTFRPACRGKRHATETAGRSLAGADAVLGDSLPQVRRPARERRAYTDGVPRSLYFMLLLSWALWLAPFIRVARGAGPTSARDRRSRWGIALQAVAYAIHWQGPFWLDAPAFRRVIAAAMLFVLGIVLSWTSSRTLGRHFRLDAGLSPNHQLIRTGPYAIIRHPIYTSMLCVLLGTGLILTSAALLAAALVVFVAGTEIRVQIEDGLLAARFGDAFQDYRRTVPAYIPFVR